MNKESQAIFSGLVWDKENVIPLDDIHQCGRLAEKCGLFFDKSEKGQLKFVHISKHKINGQRALKELVVHHNMSGICTMCVGGHNVPRCPSMLPSCTTFAEVQYNVHMLKCMDACLGFEVTPPLETFVDDLEKELWDGNPKSVRSKQCHGLSEKKTCFKCANKCKRLREKSNTTVSHNDHNYCKVGVDDVHGPSEKKFKPSFTQDELGKPISDIPSGEGASSDDSDPDYEPYLADSERRKIQSQISDSELSDTLSHIKSTIKDFAPNIAEPFLELVECQLRNSLVPDKHLVKWDIRFDATLVCI
jgi:hypothetical protein